MQLNLNQRRRVRELVQLSTDLTAQRFTVYEAVKSLQTRLRDLKGRRLAAERQSESTKRSSISGMTGQHFSDLEARIENEFKVIGELESDLNAELQLRQRELDAMQPLVSGCQRLADRVLNYAGIDGENLEPVFRGAPHHEVTS